MDAFIITEHGTDLRNLFENELTNAMSKILASKNNLEEKQIRHSSEIGATIGSRYFTVEVMQWQYDLEGKVFGHLEAMCDIKGEYFEIAFRPD